MFFLFAACALTHNTLYLYATCKRHVVKGLTKSVGTSHAQEVAILGRVYLLSDAWIALRSKALNTLLHEAIHAADVLLQNLTASVKWAWFGFQIT